MASTQAEGREPLDSRSGAIRLKDIDRLMALYSSDIVYFDLVPPLQYVLAMVGCLEELNRHGNPRLEYCGEREYCGRIYAFLSERNPKERARGRILGSRVQ
jgi:hypothetical protein